MAYNFVGSSSQYITVGSVPVSGYPCTFCAFFKTSTTGAFQHILNCGRSTSNDYFLFNQVNDANFALSQQRAGNASVNGTATGSTTMTDGVWHHLCGQFNSKSSVKLYVDGVYVTEGTTDIGAFPASLNRCTIGAAGRSTYAGFFTGNISEACIYSVALSDAEIASLAKGFKPTRVRNQSLVFYAPLTRQLIDVRTARTLTNNNTATVANHPRVY